MDDAWYFDSKEFRVTYINLSIFFFNDLVDSIFLKVPYFGSLTIAGQFVVGVLLIIMVEKRRALKQ